MTTVFEIPVKTVSEANSRDHWRQRARRTKANRKAAYLIAPPHPLPVVVHMTRISAGTLDDDNLRGALKAVRDGIADRLGLQDDSDPRVRFEYDQRVGRRGYDALRVRYEPMAAEDT